MFLGFVLERQCSEKSYEAGIITSTEKLGCRVVKYFRAIVIFGLQPYMEQLTGLKLGKEYEKAVYCQPVYSTFR